MTKVARRVQAYEATLISLTPEHIDRMHELAAKAREGMLSADEQAEVEA